MDLAGTNINNMLIKSNRMIIGMGEEHE